MLGQFEDGEAVDIGGEVLLSVLLLAGLAPVDRGELEDAAGRPGGQPAEQVAQVRPRLDAMHAAASVRSVTPSSGRLDEKRTVRWRSSSNGRPDSKVTSPLAVK